MKDIIYGILGFVNAVVCIAMLCVSYSDRLNPTEYPLLACSGLFFPFLLVAVIAFLVLWLIVLKRYLLFSIITLILCLPAIRAYTPLARPGFSPDARDLHVVSFNTHNFDYDTLYSDKSEIMEYIESSGADIVCLQETRLYDNRRAELKKYFDYIDYTEKPEGTCFVTLSRYPILKSEFINYESEGNASICLYIKYREDTLRIINNHLESTKIPVEEREGFRDLVQGSIDSSKTRQESKQLLRTLSDAMVIRAAQVDSIAKFIGENSRNTFFFGDMNDTPISYAHYRIEQVLTDCYKSAGNLWGFSYTRDGMYVRIDHAFCSEDWIPERCFVDNSIQVSDHYPIVTYLKKDIKK